MCTNSIISISIALTVSNILTHYPLPEPRYSLNNPTDFVCCLRAGKEPSLGD